MEGKKILITGGTGQVARPVAEALAEHNEVWCLGRFGTPGVREELNERGITTRQWDMENAGTHLLDGVPQDFTHVLHSAVERGKDGNFNETIEINASATGHLMTHCRTAEAFLFVSSGAVYRRHTLEHKYTEDDPIGGVADWMPTYPIGKLATEGAVRGFAAVLELPTIIARLNIAYGPNGYGGVPMLYFKRMLAGEPIAIPFTGQNWCSLLYTDDIVRQVPLLWQAASTSTTVVNWGGDESVGITDCVRYMEQLTGVEANLVPSEVTRETYQFDPTLRRKLTGPCEVNWHDGIRRTLQALYPTHMLPNKIETIRNSYEGFNRRDIEKVLAAMAPEVEWVHPDGLNKYGLGGTKHGHEGVLEFLALAPTVVGGMRLHPEEFIEDGDRVVVFGTREVTSLSGNKETLRFVHSWTMRDGKAIRMEDIFDTVEFLQLIES